MKVLVFAHRLELGGTQANAIELAAALRDMHGHEVVLFATPGPMSEVVRQKGLRFLGAPDARFHPSAARMRALRDAVRSERPDLIHAWDWWQCLEAYYAVHLPMRVPMVVTDMMMDLTRLLPMAVPTTFGTPELVDRARAAGRRRVKLILPPVDIHQNAPEAVDARPFRERHGIQPTGLTLVTVCRLAHWLKSESLFRTVEAVRVLGRELPLHYIIVGDGVLRPRLERLAGEINAEVGRRAVVLAGPLVDPRPAYAAADVVVGMGGSALRGMAFGKPVVVVGEQGFSSLFSPATAESFYYKGIYGHGDGDPGNAGLTAQLRELVARPDSFPALGQLSREFVVRHFSLESVSAQLAVIFQDAVTDVPKLHVAIADGVRTAALYLRERRFWVPSRDPAPRGA